MAYKVNFKTVSTIGLESSPVAAELAGLRANEARYYWNKYRYEFVTVPAQQDAGTLSWVKQILLERQLELPYRALEVSSFKIAGMKMAYVFYENGLSINIMYTIDDNSKRAVGIKLADGMAVPEELADKFKFARQKSKLAGTIRGSYFVIKGEY